MPCVGKQTQKSLDLLTSVPTVREEPIMTECDYQVKGLD